MLGTLLSVCIHVGEHMPFMPPHRGEMTLLTEVALLDISTDTISSSALSSNMGDSSASNHGLCPPNVIECRKDLD